MKQKTLPEHPFPRIPDYVLEARTVIEPCDDVGDWAAAAFLNKLSPLYNPDHEPIAAADICWIWTNVENVKRGKRVIGTAQVGEPQGGTPWAKARVEEQLRRWFGRVPDFLITLDAVWLSTADSASTCALIEHELYHCSQKTDRWGEPVFSKDGSPVWDMRPHDVEEFVGVAARYGARASRMDSMAKALARGPLFGKAALDGVCGVCGG